MSQQVYFAQEGMLEQFHKFSWVFYHLFLLPRIFAKNLGMCISFKGYLCFNLSIT